ncbi:SDR family NAD(P)-dependent oxidoreductase [Maricurvus nonylphenolicus]|uniref:SDR family NAD(P)-dependent oxidoreductase n=1 Tax=Maricurvus nonylphenolicus TaxID=1008307 RepID=UPI0036F2B503
MFENKVVWITGASSGIGLAFAEALHNQGAKLILSALTEDELTPVVERLSGSFPLAFDVSDFDALPGLVELALGAFGRIDVLVNNAGIVQRSLATETSLDVYRKVVDVDLMAPISLTQLVLPHMLEQGQGRIVVMSSVAGKIGSPLRSAYCAAKHGLFGYFDSLRAEVLHKGIAVHTVAPGAVKTNLAHNALRGTGERYGVPDDFTEGGYLPEYLVEQVLKRIQQGKYEIIIARGLERKMQLLHWLSPEFFHRLIAKMSPKYIEEFKQTHG